MVTRLVALTMGALMVLLMIECLARYVRPLRRHSRVRVCVPAGPDASARGPREWREPNREGPRGPRAW